VKQLKKVISLVLIGTISFVALPVSAKAETLGDYQNKLYQYEQEVKNAKDAISKNEQEIKNIESQIASIKSELKAMSQKIDEMAEEIKRYDQEIKEKSLETKQLFQYLQIASGENVYLEYAFGAENITDLIYRMSIVEQLTEYNQKTIQKLEKMIEENKQREKELNKKQKEMNAKQQNLVAKSKSIGENNITLGESAVSSEAQVKIYKDIVNRYVQAGCKTNDVIGVDCARAVSASGFYRPITRGYTTSEFGYRWGTLHQGLDVSNSDPYNTKIYPVADGVITSKYIDEYGALQLGIEHYYNGKYYTSLYYHMSQYAPGLYVGKHVTVNDYIGYMGMTGWATGPHLHLELSDCRVFNAYDKNCSTWSKYVNYLWQKYYNGSKGPRDLIYFPSEGVWFNGRV